MDEKKIYTSATFGERVMFGFEGFTAVLLVGTTLLFFQPFCTGYLGLPAAVPGIIYAVICILDAVIDPGLGILVEKTRFKSGLKYVPWYYAGVVCLSIGAVGVFWFPNIESVVWMAVFVFVMYCVQIFGNSFINVSIGPLRNLITNDPAQRSTLPAFSSLPAVLASILVALVPTFAKAFGDNNTSYRKILLIFVTLCLFAGLLVVKAMRKKDAASASQDSEKITVKDMWEEFKINRPLKMLMFSDVTTTFAASLAASSGIYFYKYVLGDYNLEIQPIVSLIGIAAGVVGAFLAAGFAKRWGRKRAYVVGTIIGIIIPCTILAIRPFQQLVIFIVITSLGSIFGGLTGNTKWVMIADCVDYGYWKTGRFVPAVYNSIFSFATQASMALAGFAISMVLGAIGFIDNNAAQPGLVITAILILQFGLPVLARVCSLIAMKRYDIDVGTYKTMMEEISDRNEAKTASSNLES